MSNNGSKIGSGISKVNEETKITNLAEVGLR